MAETIYLGRHRVGAASPALRLVTFTLNHQDYGVDVNDVYGIYHGLPLIPVADYSDTVAGEVQLAGERIPVVNLRRFGNLQEPKNYLNPRWIVMINDTRGPVGLLVDKVTEVVPLQAGALAAVPESLQDPLADYVVAMATRRERPLLLPDVIRLVRDALGR